MRLLLLLLLPSLAFGQGLTTLYPGQTAGGRVLLSLPFSTPGCSASGTGGVSITRATSSTYEEPAGTINTCAAGSYRVESSGLLVESARNNYVQKSASFCPGGTITAPWGQSSATCTAQTGAPDGGTWAEITSSATSGVALQTTASASAAAVTLCSWMRKASGTGAATIGVGASAFAPSTCTCVRSDGGACVGQNMGGGLTDYCEAKVSDLGTTPIRLCLTATGTAKVNMGVYLYPGERNVSTGTTRFSLVTLETAGTPSSYIACDTTPCARNADAVSVTNPTIPSKWQLSGAFKKYTGGAWTSGTPWSLGTSAAANSASLTMGAANLVFTVIDGSTASKTCTVTSPGYAAGSSQSLAAKDLAGALSLTGTCTQAGAGSGSFGTSPTTLYLGQTSAGDQFNGYVKSLKIEKVTN